MARAHTNAIAGTLAVALLAAAAPVRAQSEVIIDPAKKYASPRNFAVELRFGPYRPDVDSQFHSVSTAPYQEYFGSGSGLMSQLEFDWEIFKRFGTVAVGVASGYFGVTGHSLVAATGTKSGDETSLKIVPISGSLIYRFDLLADRWRIPLSPYAKLGLDYDIWWITNGNGDISKDSSGNKGRGGTLGWHVAAGLSVLLDILDPDAARQFDSETGVNHTYAFFEYGHYDISGLGASNRLTLSDDTWMAGIMFEF